ncbi:MAG TPA: glycosyltransferase [Cytophagaceae bacterium]
MDKRLKILFVSKWFPHREIPFSGVFVLRHAKAVARFSSVYILDARPLKKVSGLIEKNKKVEDGVVILQYYYPKRLTGISFLDKPLKLLLYYICMLRGYRTLSRQYGKPDLTHVHILLRTGIFALLLKTFANVKYIITEHWSGYLPESRLFKGALRVSITKYIATKASWVTAVSEKLKSGMIQSGISHQRFSVVPNVIDTEVFKVTPPKASTPPTIIFIADLIDEVKNISGAIRAVSEARKINPNFQLHIYGEGKDRKKLEELIDQLQLNSCVFLKGEVSPSELSCALSEAAFLLLFSNFETFSCVIAEAFAAGKPVIATNTGAIPELVKPEYGIMVEKGNIFQLSEAIITMLKDYPKYNSEKLRSFSVNNFSYEKVGQAFVKIYEHSVKS